MSDEGTLTKTPLLDGTHAAALLGVGAHLPAGSGPGVMASAGLVLDRPETSRETAPSSMLDGVPGHSLPTSHVGFGSAGVLDAPGTSVGLLAAPAEPVAQVAEPKLVATSVAQVAPAEDTSASSDHGVKSRPRCCQLSPDDQLWIDVREAIADLHRAAYSADKKAAAIAEVLVRHGEPLTVAEVQEHLHRHFPRTPVPPRAFWSWKAAERVKKLTSKEKDVLLHIARLGITTNVLVAEMEFGQAATEASSYSSANSYLRCLDKYGCLTRFPVKQIRPSKGPRSAWVLSKLGLEVARLLLAEHPRGGELNLNAWAGDGIYGSTLKHDLALGSLLARLYTDVQQDPQRKFNTPGGELIVELHCDPDNLLGGAQLMMGYAPPEHWRAGSRINIATNLRADALLGVGVKMGQHEWVVPLLVEYNSGSKRVVDHLRPRDEAGLQLWKYVPFQLSGAAYERFPNYKESKTAFPLLWATRGRTTANDTDLVKAEAVAEDYIARLIKRFDEHRASVRWANQRFEHQPLAPIYVANHITLMREGFRCPVISLHRPVAERTPRPLLLALLADSDRFKPAGLSMDAVLRFDPKGAKPINEKSAIERRMTVAQAEERERLLAEDDLVLSRARMNATDDSEKEN
jgi:hypothetical protein